jgi:hypothetical protein
VGPSFHRAYASRLAWRYRLLLALALALLGLSHPLFALLSPLGLLLPTRLWEGRALWEISRVSLAYPTALAYGEERLWAEARKAPLRLPPFPLGLLFLYLLALVLALLLAAWRAEGAGGGWALPRLERPATPQGASGREEGASQARGEETGRDGASERGSSPGQGGGSFRREGEAPASQGGTSGEVGPSQGEGASGASPGPRGGVGSGTGDVQQGPPVLPPTPQGEEAGLLPPGEGEGEGLPSPWPAGRPPERVRRGVEVYLEKTPLAPEARELLRRYFAAP